ncbi:hypothetical protein Q757_04270 [Oenococcus alcoholitolerans]|uniref:DNA endonuclease I-HmuI-like NUMOD-like domain-containing protein n=1 Tax=Oenococcus alcoholitolerans TaxID=931074 RepID=A0ABR4XQZ9_9LACO|nr:hypothetical protein Q757_04270 [Oenococcus alcoholitolerans]
MFIDNPDGYQEINHLDEDKLNNCVSNLEWCDRKYNCNYGTRTQRIAKNLSKPIIAINLSTHKKIKFNSVTEASKQLLLFRENISAVLHGRCKQVGGYTFKFI